METYRKKGCGRIAVAPHTLPGMSKLLLQKSYKSSRLHFTPNPLKTLTYSPSTSSVVVSGSLCIPLMIFSKILTRSFNQDSSISHPTVRQIVLISSDCHVRFSSHDTRGQTQTQAPGRACGQAWPAPPALVTATSEPLALAAANTNIMLCSHGNQSVMFIILSFLEEKRHRSGEEKSKSPKGLRWGWAGF